VVLETGDVYAVTLGASTAQASVGAAGPLAAVFSPSVVQRLPTPQYQLPTQQHGVGTDIDAVVVEHQATQRLRNAHQHWPVLATCAGDDRVSGLIRQYANTLELSYLHPDGHLVNFLNVSLKTPKDLESHSEGVKSAYFPASQPAQYETASNIVVTAVHVIVTDRTYLISVVGKMAPAIEDYGLSATEEAAAAPVYLFSGSVTLPDTPYSTMQAVLRHQQSGTALDATPYLATLKQRVLLDALPLASTSAAAMQTDSTRQRGAATTSASALKVHNSVSFVGRHCAVVTAEAIYVVDLFKVKFVHSSADCLCARVCMVGVRSEFTRIRF
jgi:hypothetical protein